MQIKARTARVIRKASRQRSQHQDGLGVSELFLAPPSHARVILEAHDPRLKRYLLGFTHYGPPGSETPA